MKNRFAFLAVTALALICLVFTSCPTAFDSPDDGGDVGPPWGNMVEGEFVPFSTEGSVTRVARGFQSQVRVTFTVTDGVIENIVIDASGESTNLPEVASVSTVLPGLIRNRNAFDFPANVISGATVTTAAVLAAGRAAVEWGGLVRYLGEDQE